MRSQILYPIPTAAFIEQAEPLLKSNVAFEHFGAYPTQLAHGLAEIAGQDGLVTRWAVRDLAKGKSELTQGAIDLVGARTTPTALAKLLAPGFFDRFFGPGPGGGEEGQLASWGVQVGAGLVPG